MKAQLVVALDLPEKKAALALAEKLLPVTPWLKVGLELFTAAGPEALAPLKDLGARIFLDLKFHDIPRTVGRAVAAALRGGADMCNVHLAGGEAMCRAAVEAAREARGRGGRGLLLGVTVLTSTEDSEEGETRGRVLEYALQARAWGLDGVVCSGREAAGVKAAAGAEFICLCPGIRLAGVEGGADDQRRVTSPLEAARAGADFLVAGRSVLNAADPARAARAIIASYAED